MSPGVYYDLPMADYLAIPAVSNSALRALLERCPAAAWYESAFNPNRPPDDTDATDASDAGTIAHAILLEGSEACCEVFNPADYPNADGKGVAGGWTNKAIRTARDAARAAGRIPVLADKMGEIRAMVEAARKFIYASAVYEPSVYQAFEPAGGRSEVTFVWHECETLCKCRTDRISTDFAVAIDYKSTATSVEPNAWARTMLDYVGAAWYRRGIRACTGVDAVYLFLCGERAPPYLHSLIGLNPPDVALGDEKVGYALREWQRCEQAGEWPAYPARVCYPDLPPWHYAQWLERNGGGDDLPPADEIFGRRAA